ncbi:MAG: diguanylate cyclase [Elusimicrobiota bacterium]
MKIESLKKHRARILAVDNDETSQKQLKMILNEEGCDVHILKADETASKQVDENPPDMILVNPHNTHHDGLRFLWDFRQKNNSRGAFIPVIFLTPFKDQSRYEKTFWDSMDDFVSDLNNPQELTMRVRNLLKVQEFYRRSQFLSTHDALTKCYNRPFLIDFLNRSFERYKRFNEPVTCLRIEIGGVGVINDQLGHESGDHLIRQVGFALQDFFRAVDCISRWGGDDFTVLLPDCNIGDIPSIQERWGRFIEKFYDQLGFPPNLKEIIKLSVGVASLPWHTRERDDLFKLADRSMEQARMEKKPGFVISKI